MASHHVSPLFRLLTPLLQSLRSATIPASLRLNAPLAPTSLRTFTTSSNVAAGGPGQKGKKIKKDPRITLIRYHLQHPRTPRPLRLSRMRGLRHWTIHRAWMLFRRKKAESEELELQRMYRSMHDACEELRLLEGPGEKDGSRLYRIAMEKKGIFKPGGVPIEYARAQTETPGKEAWNHGWTR